MLSHNPKLIELATLLKQHPRTADLLLHNGLQKVTGVRFLRQQPIDEYILDFFAPEVHLAIEIYNPYAVGTRKSHKQLKRLLRLQQLDVELLRFTEQQVNQNLSRVLRTIGYHISIQRERLENENFVPPTLMQNPPLAS